MRTTKKVTIGVACLILAAVGAGSAGAVGAAGAAGALRTVGTQQAPTCSSDHDAWYPDFDGNTTGPDVPVGIPGDKGGVGRVEIRYDAGTAKTLLAPDAKPGDRFGTEVFPDEMNGDKCWDLLVGAPGRTVNGLADAGSVYVFLGSDDGLVYSETLEMGVGRTPGPAQKGARFGSELSETPYSRLAGVPKYDVGAATDAGAFLYLGAGPAGLIHQDSAGIPGTAETGDNFGAALSPSAYDGYENGLYVSAPNEDIGTVKDAGVVLQGLLADEWEWSGFSQDSAGVPGTAEAGDQLGASLAAGYFGVPGEDIGSKTDAGAVMVHWWVLGGSDLWTRVSQDTPGIAGAAEQGDRFGTSLASGATASNGIVAVGVPGEDFGTIHNAGVVNHFGVRQASGTLQISDHGTVSASSAGGQPTVGAQLGFAGGFYYAPGPGFRSYGAPGAAGGNGYVIFKNSDGGFRSWSEADSPEPGEGYGTVL